MEMITTHKNADFDALASVLAACALYPRAAPVLPAALNPNVRDFLSMHKDLFVFPTVTDMLLSEMERLVVVDACRWSRLEDLEALREKQGLIIHVWDHHRETPDIQAQWSCLEHVGATTTLLTRELERRAEEISPILATLFLAGIYEDTGNLSFPGTTAADARAAAFLLEQKANLDVVNTFLRPVYGPKQKDVLFAMLQSAQPETINGYRVSVNSAAIEGHTPGLAVVVEMYRDILNVDAAFGIFLEARKGRSFVIGRSAVDGINIGSVMRTMGGGGHPRAGSAMVKESSAQMLRDWILELIRGDQHASIQVKDLMSSPVVTVPHDASMKEVAQVLREKGCTGFPVMQGDCIVGIVSRRDFMKVNRPSRLSAPVSAYMAKKVITVDPQCSVGRATRLMVKHDIGRLPVVDNGKLVGIVTRSDAIRHYYDFLPE